MKPIQQKSKKWLIVILFVVFSIGMAVQYYNNNKFEHYVTSHDNRTKQFEISLNLIVLINQIDRNLMHMKNNLTTNSNSGIVENNEQLKQRLLDTRAKAVAVMDYLQKHEHNLTPETLFEANKMLETIKNDYRDIKELLDQRLNHLNNS